MALFIGRFLSVVMVQYVSSMGIRLATFDYKAPYFYMVTLKAEKGGLPFCRIRREPTAPARYIEPNAVTQAFVEVIMGFHKVWRCVEPIETFSVMPDHIHLLVKIRKIEGRVSLPKIVWQLKRRLEKAYLAAVGAAASNTLTAGEATSGASSRAGGLHVFEREWHDWIVKKDGQLAAFTRYIRDNPRRAWLRGPQARAVLRRRADAVSFALFGDGAATHSQGALRPLPRDGRYRGRRAIAPVGR